MRGKVWVDGRVKFSLGITPAYAGKSNYPVMSREHCQDHPRVCGEKIMYSFIADTPLGSPPRMRGKETLLRTALLYHRITPAYAGKSVSVLRHPVCCWDHPRVCGEKPVCAKGKDIVLGSPPRMRGKGTGWL